MTLTRAQLLSPNWSSRGGTAVRLAVVHTAQGARDIYALGNYFASSSSGVSSHVGIDDQVGLIGEYVHRPNKAWTQANANPYSVAAELCAFAEWDAAEWSRHGVMLANTAAWIAEECAYFGLPVRKLSAAEAQGGAAGVCGHADLGVSGGNHWDPGPNFPWADVLDMAAGAAPPTLPLEPSYVLIGEEFYPMTVFRNDYDARLTAVLSWWAQYLYRHPDNDSLQHWQAVIEADGMSSAFSNFLLEPEVQANLARSAP